MCGVVLTYHRYEYYIQFCRHNIYVFNKPTSYPYCVYSLVLERGKAGAGGEADTGDGSLLACPHSVPLKTGTISST